MTDDVAELGPTIAELRDLRSCLKKLKTERNCCIKQMDDARGRLLCADSNLKSDQPSCGGGFIQNWPPSEQLNDLIDKLSCTARKVREIEARLKEWEIL